VADHESGTVDSPRPLALAADDAFRQVLGAEIRMIEVLGFLEHVFAEGAVVESGGCDRAHVMKASRLNAMREFDDVPRAVDVRPLLVLGAGGQIVDRGQVEQMRDLAFEAFDIFGGDTQVGLRQVADDRDQPLFVDAPGFAQRRELLERALAHQQIDRFAALEQILDQKTADEPGSAGNEINHRVLPWACCARRSIGTSRICFRRRARAHPAVVAGIIRRGVCGHGAASAPLV